MMLPVRAVNYDSAVPVTMPAIVGSDAGMTGLGFDWSFVEGAISSAQKILLPAVATRIQTQPGVSITTTPGGQVISQQASGYPIVAGNIGASSSGIGAGTMLIGAGLIVAFLLLGRR